MRLSSMYLALLVLALGGAAIGGPTILWGQSSGARPGEVIEELERAAVPLASVSAQPRGLVRPSREVILRSPLNEQLESVLVIESQRVRAGEVVARLDSREQELAVQAAKLESISTAQLRRAELAVEEAAITLEIVENVDEYVVGPYEVRRARLAKRQAEADHELAGERVEHAQLSYKRQQARLERYTIAAPFDGTIHRIEAERGSLLSSDQPILSIVALDPLHAVVYVPISDHGRLERGGVYRFEAAAPIDRTLTGKLIVIDPVLDPASQSFRCVFEIENPESALPAGFTVRLLGAAQ